MTQHLLRNLRPEQRYLFTAKNQNKEYTFRADFVVTRGFVEGEIDTLLVKNVDCATRGEINDCGRLSMPASWITKVETLENIAGVILPSEILVCIDSYV